MIFLVKKESYCCKGEGECQTLWDDIFAFAFPENDSIERARKMKETFIAYLKDLIPLK